MADAVTPKVGDVVQVKSGGPEMTVSSQGTGPYVGQLYCVWMDGNGKKCTGSFDPATLKVVR